MSFEAFYRRTRHREPFPWMCRLAERFAAGSFPQALQVPTGCGKTEIVAVWAWARLELGSVPRRLWMASDRRVIVDQAFEAARSIGHDILVSRLRGGMVIDDEPILDPERSQVICTTIDQLGSRLLFRAYGSTPRSWPIWAGLAGNDSLVILDEAHLSPNAEDVFQRCVALGADLRVISMTATPLAAHVDVLGLGRDDDEHPVLRRRVESSKVVELRKELEPEAAVRELLDQGCRRVAVVCNTVRAARRAFGSIGHADKVLLIGRQRPLDRDRLLADLVPRVQSGAAATEPVVVVTTQCIEAGADFDFDGMVSEACPLDALRQRLGRLDRLGNAGTGRCILLAPGKAKEVAPYGRPPIEAWRWLGEKASKGKIDLGSRAWRSVGPEAPVEAFSSAKAPVTLMEPHLRMLARTSPRPLVEPDVDLLLHGPGRQSADISVVWRRDVDEADPEAATEILALVPPTGLEVCDVPLWEFLAFRSGRQVDVDGGDVEGAAEPPRVERTARAPAPAVLRWEGGDVGVSLVAVEALRPGDIVVLPATAGGYDRFGWNAASKEAVTDVADEAYALRTGRRIQRLDDPEADVTGWRVRRWSGGTVVETRPEGTPSARGITPEVLLDTHSRSVAERARAAAEALGLKVIGELEEAGLRHDAGKAHPGWQLMIKGGDPRRLTEPPLAKGHMTPTPLSRLPVGWRHEAHSVALLSHDTADLVRWLVATHHGHARPFWPIADHGIGLAELMEKLQREHGYWRLALYEAVLRCADRAVSKAEGGDA